MIGECREGKCLISLSKMPRNKALWGTEEQGNEICSTVSTISRIVLSLTSSGEKREDELLWLDYTHEQIGAKYMLVNTHRQFQTQI